jgi:hypothetical protein
VNVPSPTPERRKRFEAEFAEYWDGLDHAPHDNHGDRTNMESMWVKARTYSEEFMKEDLDAPHGLGGVTR